jgi:hypothetical protein
MFMWRLLPIVALPGVEISHRGLDTPWSVVVMISKAAPVAARIL